MLGPLLLPEELDVIFGRVTSLFARLLSDAFQRLDPRVSPHLGLCCVCAAFLLAPISSTQALPALAGENPSVLCMRRCHTDQHRPQYTEHNPNVLRAQDGNWRAQCRADLQHLLAQLESLPMSPTERTANLGPLRVLLDPPDGLFSSQHNQQQRPSRPVKEPPPAQVAPRVSPAEQDPSLASSLSSAPQGAAAASERQHVDQAPTTGVLSVSWSSSALQNA